MTPSEPVPDDICIYICSFIHCQGPKPLFTKSQANAALRSLSATSRAWLFASRSIQYEKLHVRTAAHLAKLLIILQHHNYLATHIRALSVGKTLDSHITLSTWSARFVDFRVFEVLLPQLQAFQILNISHLRPPQDRVFRSFDHTNLPQHSRLTSLAVRASFFHDTAEARMFFRPLTGLRQVFFQAVSPSFVRMLPTYLPPSVTALRLEEYSLWELESSGSHGPIPPPPPMAHISLNHFFYRDLTLHAARELDPILIAFASGALVKIGFVRTQYPCREFDFPSFKSRITKAAHRILLIAPSIPNE